MKTKDFNKWLSHKTLWDEVAYRYNTGRDYQDKQSLSAAFFNSYIYIEQKLKAYYADHHEIPYDALNDMVFNFRKYFPKSGRVEGVNYFDDLIEAITKQYKGFNVQKFSKTSTEQKNNGSKGGKAKGENNYREFCKWVHEKKFDVEGHRTTAHEPFAIVLKSEGFRINEKPVSPKTAVGYRDKFLSEFGASK